MVQESAVTSYRNMDSWPKAGRSNVKSFTNWVFNNKPLIKEESEFILSGKHRSDLFAVAKNDVDRFDRLMRWLLNITVPDRIGRKVRNVSVK
jgi:uncharacterized protein DUF6594